MKIVAWSSQDAPPSQRWLARYLDGKRFLPAFFTAPTEAQVIARAEAFWESERQRLAGMVGKKPASVADSIIERVGKPDLVIEEEDAEGIVSVDTPAADPQIDLEEAIAAADIDLLADL